MVVGVQLQGGSGGERTDSVFRSKKQEGSKHCDTGAAHSSSASIQTVAAARRRNAPAAPPGTGTAAATGCLLTSSHSVEMILRKQSGKPFCPEVQLSAAYASHIMPSCSGAAQECVGRRRSSAKHAFRSIVLGAQRRRF